MTEIRIILACLAMSLLGNSPAVAKDIGHREALELRRSGAILPFETILARLQERHPGATLVEVELEAEGTAFVYEIEIFSAAGELRELELDARSGQILKDELED